jgi:hypothetical protein
MEFLFCVSNPYFFTDLFFFTTLSESLRLGFFKESSSMQYTARTNISLVWSIGSRRERSGMCKKQRINLLRRSGVFDVPPDRPTGQ